MHKYRNKHKHKDEMTKGIKVFKMFNHSTYTSHLIHTKLYLQRNQMIFNLKKCTSVFTVLFRLK